MQTDRVGVVPAGDMNDVTMKANTEMTLGMNQARHGDVECGCGGRRSR